MAEEILQQDNQQDKQKDTFLSFIWEIVKIVVISLVIVIPIRYFLIQPFFVKGQSMEPNFDDGQYLIVDEISYRLHQPERGDVIVFKYPNDPSQYYIKRIIGLPGETVEVVGGGIIVYNDQYPHGLVLDEEKYLDAVKTMGDMKITLESGQYFVLGDNRSASSDSRRWGPLDKGFIVGRVWVRVWPFDKANVFATPNY
jgi:signal peptidase I